MYVLLQLDVIVKYVSSSFSGLGSIRILLLKKSTFLKRLGLTRNSITNVFFYSVKIFLVYNRT